MLLRDSIMSSPLEEYKVGDDTEYTIKKKKLTH